jgi:hypothetical protein
VERILEEDYIYESWVNQGKIGKRKDWQDISMTFLYTIDIKQTKRTHKIGREEKRRKR